jgi:hypothetical protein
MRADYYSEKKGGGIIYISYKEKERLRFRKVMINLLAIGYVMLSEEEEEKGKFVVTFCTNMYLTIVEMREDYKFCK